MNDFETYTLADLSIGNKGSYGLAESAIPFSKDAYRYIRISDITDDGFLSNDDLKSVKYKNIENYELKKNDIVFARTGNSTGRNYFFNGTEGKCAYAGFLIKFSLDSEKVNPLYVKYYCKSQLYWNWVKSFNTGSTRGNINANTFAQMPILVPSKQKQDKIAALLEALEQKMIANNAINDNLAA